MQLPLQRLLHFASRAMDDEDWQAREALQHPPCTEPGCEGTASCPGHLSAQGKNLCSRCAARIAKRCQRCSIAFNPSYGGFDCYAVEFGPDKGQAVCLGCWSSSYEP